VNQQTIILNQAVNFSGTVCRGITGTICAEYPDDTQLNEWKANYDESGLPNIYVHSDMWEGYSRPDKYERLDFEMGAYFLNDAYLDFKNGNLRSL